MRARVLGRARTIAVQKSVAALAAVALVAAVASYGRFGDESSARVRAVDSPVESSGLGIGADAPLVGGSADPATVPAGAAGPPASGQAGSAVPGAVSADELGAPTLPASVVLVDPPGDARYRGWCDESDCATYAATPWSSQSQPALDMVSLDVQCSARSFDFVFTMADLFAPPAPNPVGQPANRLIYSAVLTFDESRSMTFSAYRTLADDTWETEVHVTDPNGYVPAALAIVGSSLRISVPTASLPWRPGPGDGARLSGGTVAHFDSPLQFDRAYTDDWNSWEQDVFACR